MYGLIFTGYSRQNTTAGRSTGGYRIATYLRKLGWNIEVVDYLTYWSLEQLQKLIEQRNTSNSIKWVGISITWTSEDPIVRDLIDYIKKHYPLIKIIVGGNTNFTTDLKANYYINGFGEKAMAAVLAYEFGNDKKPYGTICHTGWAINALNFYPAWPMNDYSVEYEDRDFLRESDVLTLELSRGCKFKCKYCEFPVLGVKEDTSVSEEVIYSDLMKVYNRWGIKNYTLADETLNERDEKIKKLIGAVKRVEFEPNFTGFIRLDLFHSNRHQIEMLTEARVWGQFYGIETFNNKSGKLIGKGLHSDKNKQLMLDTKKYMLDNLGYYRGTASFIAGLPYESQSDLKDTHDWLEKNWVDQHWHFWPLTIPKSTNYRLSAFGEDLSKFGYEELRDHDIGSRDIYSAHWAFPQALGELFPQVLWKNDQGDIFQFSELAKKYDAVHGETSSKSGNWPVWAYLSLGASIEEALNLKSYPKDSKWDVERSKIISSYIEKKLSL